MTPFFSIIIPTLNEETYLPKLLSDLSKQQEKNFEVVIVDGHSEDKTQAVVREFSRKMPIQFHGVSKRNVAHQRNVGATHARGEYVIFLDADVRVSANFTQIAKRVVTKEKSLIFLPFALPTDARNNELKVIFNFLNMLINLSQSIAKPFCSIGASIFERSFFLRIGGYDEKIALAEDHDIIQRAYTWGVHAKFVNKIRVRVSTRRMKREGKLQLLFKYAVSTAHILFKGNIKTKIYDYEMGGKQYDGVSPRKREYSAQDYLKMVQHLFRTLE